MSKVIIACLSHESNTFNPIIAKRDDFNIYHGEELLNHLNTEDTISGITHELRERDYVPVPLLSARAVPNGLVSFDLYQEIKRDWLAGLQQILDENETIVGIVFALHGSMRIENFGEAEGDILEATRSIFPTVPLTCALDMHATVSAKMLEHCDAFVGYKAAPHIDCFETGQHAVQMFDDIVQGTKKPTMSWVRVPILIAGEQTETNVEPMKSLIQDLREIEKNPAVMATSYLLGFPWADCVENGVNVLVVTDRDQALADKIALQLAQKFWDTRNKFTFHTESYATEKALAVAGEYAQDKENCPVYVSDSGDNPTAGSSADCMQFLRDLISFKQNLNSELSIVYGGIYDPEVVKLCGGKVGETLSLSLGAKFDTKTTESLHCEAEVLAYKEGYSNYHSTNVLLKIEGVLVIVASKHIGFVSTDLFTFFGLDPLNIDIICVKLGYLTASHKKIAKKVVMALSEGSSNEILENLIFEQVPRPIFPLDKDFSVQLKVESC